MKLILFTSLCLIQFSACATTSNHDTAQDRRVPSSGKLIYNCEPDGDSWAVTQKLELTASKASVSFKSDYSHQGEDFDAERDDHYKYVPDSHDRRDKTIYTKRMRGGGKAIIVDADMLEGARRGDMKIRYYETKYPADEDGTRNTTYSCVLK